MAPDSRAIACARTGSETPSALGNARGGDVSAVSALCLEWNMPCCMLHKPKRVRNLTPQECHQAKCVNTNRVS